MKFAHLFSSPVVIALLLSGRAEVAQAQTPQPATPAPPPAAEPENGTQRVDVVGSQDAARSASTSFKQVVGAAELVRFGDSSVLDVLRRQPGVVVNGVAGSRGGQISMRGMGAAHVRILLNGEPAPPGFSLDNLAPDLVERIEIVPVATAELGMQAIGGTINIVLKRNTANRQRQLKLGVYSIEGETRPQASGSFGNQGDKWSWLVTGAARQLAGDETVRTQTQGYEATGPLLRRLEQFNQDRGWTWNLAPRVNLKLGGKDTLTLQSFFSKNRYDSAGYDRRTFLEGPVLPFANDRYVSAGSSTQLRNNLTWSKTLGDASKLEMKLGSTHSRETQASTISFLGDGGGVTNLQQTRADDDSRGLTASAKLRSTFAKTHTVVSGIEVEDTQADAVRGNLIDSVSQLDAIGTAFDIATRRYAVYAQDEWDVSERWSLYLGLRWEQVALLSKNNLGQRVDNSRAVLSPVVQSVWRLPGTKSDQVRLGIARTWRVPPTNNLIAGRTVSNVNTVTTPDISGNPNLKAELAWGLDLAYEHYFAKDALVTTTAFVRRIEDVLLTKTSLIGGRWVAMPVNQGNAVSRGIEIEVKGKLNQFFDSAPAIDLRANLSRAWSSVDAVPGPDNRIAGQSPLSANLGADYTFKSVPVTGGASFGFVRNGEVRVSPFESAYGSDNRSVEAYVLWKMHRNAMLRLSVANILRQDDIQRTTYVYDSLAVQKRSERPTYAVMRAIVEWKF